MNKNKISVFDAVAQKILTYNGCGAWSSLESPVVDCGALIGGKQSAMMHGKRDYFLEPQNISDGEREARQLLIEAYEYSKEGCLRNWMRARNCRGYAGGLGIKRVVPLFGWHLVRNNCSDAYLKNLGNLVKFGSWNDVVKSWNVPVVREYVPKLIIQALTDPESLVGSYPGFEELATVAPQRLIKYLPRKNVPSGKKTKDLYSPGLKGVPGLAERIAAGLGFTGKGWEKKYRHYLTNIENSGFVVERLMCEGKWGEISGPDGRGLKRLPSKAYRKYLKAIRKHCKNEMQMFVNAVKAGVVAGPNAQGLQPYEFYGKFRSNTRDKLSMDALQIQWDNMPRNFADSGARGIVILDTSASMTDWNFYRRSYFSRLQHHVTVPNADVMQKRGDTPMVVGAMTGLFLSEQMPEPWTNFFASFASQPQFFKVRGNNVYEKMQYLRNHSRTGGTNYLAVHQAIVKHGKNNHISRDKMLNMVIVITDAEFDQVSFGYTAHEEAMKLYDKAGYDRPLTVYWIVNSYNKNMPVRCDEFGTVIVSGFDPTPMEFIKTGQLTSPYQMIMDQLGHQAYDSVVVC